jgi:hypothetical protein
MCSRDSASMERDIAELKERLARDEQANTELQSDVRVVTDKLTITQGQLKKARAEAVAQDILRRISTGAFTCLAEFAVASGVCEITCSAE